MDSSMYLRLINLLKNFDNPAALNTAGIILIFNEMFEDAYSLFLYNANINGDDRAKKYINEFEIIKKYIYDFNLALELAKNNKFSVSKNILRIYLNQGMITINGLKLLMICLIKEGKIEEYNILNKKLIDLDINLDLDKYIKIKKYKKRSIIYASLMFPTVVVGFYMGQYNKKIEKINNISLPQKEVVYKYIEDSSSKELKEALEDDLERIFYNKGLNFYKKKDYINSYKNFKLSYKYTNNSYLKQHSLFLLAKSASFINKREAVLYYKDYINQFRGGCYYNEALYDLCLILYDLGDVTSKEYAKLIDKNTIYFNTKVKTIIKGGE